jgi:hypothetical protein
VLLGVVLATASCSHGLPSQGTYDAVLPSQTVLTLRLERLDHGKVEGSLQGTAVNPATNTVVNLPVFDLQGEVFKGNLSLNSTNSPKPVSYLGQVKGSTITLQYGNETTVFQQVGATQHTAHLAVVERRAAGLRDFHDRQTALKKILTELAAQQNELSDYIQWEPKFTQDVAGLQQWYATQLADYQKCLASIQAAAASNIPKWRWQGCALQANTASYARQQTLRNLATVENKQNMVAASITAAIANTSATIATIQQQTQGLLADCKYAADPAACEQLYGKANQTDKGQKALFSSQDVEAFQSFQPTASKYLTTLDGIQANDATHLESLASAIEAVYSKAN